MQNTKAVKFEEGVAFFSGEDRYLVPGQKVRIGVKAPWSCWSAWEVEDYSVLYQDELTGAIVVRRAATNGISVLSRTTMLDRESFAIEYCGIEVDGQMVFPGDVVVVYTFDGEFEAEYICAEDAHDLVRIRKISTGEIGAVSYDSLSKKVEPKEYVEIGEWVMINGEPYIVAMVGVDEWAMISAKSGNRFNDPEDGVIVHSCAGRVAIPKQTMLAQTDKVGAKVEFCGKIEILQCGVNDE